MREEAVVEVFRAGQIESRHKVSFAIVAADGQLWSSAGDPDLVAFLRSSAKPFQAIPFIDSGAADHFGIEPNEIALICASHSGLQMHVDRARQILAKIGLSEEALECGIHVPYDADAYKQLIRSGGSLKPIRNNCSGKHAAMLGLAKFIGADLDTYLDPAHPVQQRISDALASMSGVAPGSMIVGIDGCSAPTFAMPLWATARAYARFVDDGDQKGDRAEASRRIFAAMTAHPEFVGGPGRFDTLFMQAVGGRMVSKSGAEGFQAIGIPRSEIGDGSPALGLAIKVHDGDHKEHRAAALMAVELVDRLGAFRNGEREKLSAFDVRQRVNLRGFVVGQVRINPRLQKELMQNHERL